MLKFGINTQSPNDNSPYKNKIYCMKEKKRFGRKQDDGKNCKMTKFKICMPPVCHKGGTYQGV
jgi:hypothetical protein